MITTTTNSSTSVNPELGCPNLLDRAAYTVRTVPIFLASVFRRRAARCHRLTVPIASVEDVGIVALAACLTIRAEAVHIDFGAHTRVQVLVFPAPRIFRHAI
jgi:hypothetical protein